MITLGALLLTACGVPTEDRARTSSLRDAPVEISIPSSTPPRDAGADVWTLYYVRDGQLVPVSIDADASASPRRYVRMLADQPGHPAGLRTALSDADLISEVSVAAGAATVALDSGFAELTHSEQTLALGQIVFTLTELPGIGLVRFTLGDEPIAVPRPDGTIADARVSRDDFASLLVPRS